MEDGNKYNIKLKLTKNHLKLINVYFEKVW